MEAMIQSKDERVSLFRGLDTIAKTARLDVLEHIKQIKKYIMEIEMEDKKDAYTGTYYTTFEGSNLKKMEQEINNFLMDEELLLHLPFQTDTTPDAQIMIPIHYSILPKWDLLRIKSRLDIVKGALASYISEVHSVEAKAKVQVVIDRLTEFPEFTLPGLFQLSILRYNSTEKMDEAYMDATCSPEVGQVFADFKFFKKGGRILLLWNQVS